MSSPKYYIPQEERLNIYSHGIGAILAVIATFLLIIKGSDRDKTQLLTFITFGFSMIVLYSASTLYHSAKSIERRAKLRIADHIGIYFLIAGSYTPFCLTTLKEHGGIYLLVAIWTLAFIGSIFKLFFTGKFVLISTLAYVLMGWSVIFFIGPLIENSSSEALRLLSIGAISYCLGAILYLFKKIPLNHFIFHVFVLIGSISHFFAVYLYL